MAPVASTLILASTLCFFDFLKLIHEGFFYVKWYRMTKFLSTTKTEVIKKGLCTPDGAPLRQDRQEAPHPWADLEP